MFFRALSLFSLATVFAAAQPVIAPSGVVNAASNSPSAFTNSRIAQGSIFLINGTGLGADNPTPLNLLDTTTFPLPSSQGLNGTTVQVKTNISSTAAILLYESPSVIAAIMPSNVPFGAATVTVSYNGQTSAPASIMVAQHKFDTFTRNNTGYGPGILFNYNSSTDTPLNGISRPAKPGQPVVLIGTGLGAVRGDETQGTYAADMPGLVLNLTIYVGGKTATIDPNQDFVGRLNGVAGVDQIFFQVPQGVTGCYVPVIVVSDGLPSNSATMAITADGSPCSEPSVGLAGADLQNMIANNSARVGLITLTRVITTATGPAGTQQGQSDSGNATFTNYTPAEFGAAPGNYPSPGGCVVQTINGALGPTPAAGVPLDAGAGIFINGPSGAMQLTPANTPGPYSAMLGTSFLEAGSYEVDDGSGGGDVGGFQAMLNTPAAFTWTNQSSGGSVAKNAPLTIAWRGGDPASLVSILGLSQDSSGQIGAIFSCSEKNSAGSFTIPGYILSWMPTNSVANSLIGVSDVVQSSFSAPGLDAGYLIYQIGQGVNVQFTTGLTGKI